LSRFESADLFGCQVYLQYLSCISVCHVYAPSFGAGGFGGILGNAFGGGARLTSYPATSVCEGGSFTSLSALAAQVSMQACLPPGPPFWLQLGASAHKSHFVDFFFAEFQIVRWGLCGQELMHLLQPMHFVWSILLTLPLAAST
jgi:hypothetical protein